MSSDLENKSTLEDFGLTSLPIEWGAPVIGDLLAEDRGISVGVMYPGDHCEQGIPLVKAGDLKSNWINPNPHFRITPDKHYEYRRTELEGGELLISLVGNAGQTAVVPSEMKGWNVARAVAVVRLSNGADPHFIKYALQSPALGQLMKSWCNTTVQETLNLKEIRRLPIPFPATTEQKSIAHILSTLDDKIELNRKTNETLEAMAKSIYKSWFVDFDPVRAKAEDRATGLSAEINDLFPDSFEDSELGEIPNGWCVSTIGEKIKWNHGKTWEAHLRVEDSTITALGSNGIMGKSALEMGCDRIVVMGNRGSCGALNDFNGAYWVTNNAYYIAEKENSYFEYWRQVLRSIDFAPFIGGSSNPFMPLKNFAHICVVCPPDSMLRHFSQSGVIIREKIERIDQESALLSQIRDALLPKLISGEIRIPDAEKMLEEVGV